MSNKFTRNITNIKNVLKQGLETNNQNDLLSQNDGNVFIRTLKRYHGLTDNIKEINGVNTDMIKQDNKVLLPLYLGMSYNYNKVEKLHMLRFNFIGNTANTYFMNLDTGNMTGGVYNPSINVTTYTYTLTDYSARIATLMTINGINMQSVTDFSIPYVAMSDYSETDRLSPSYIKNRNLIATKVELNKLDSDLTERIDKAIPPFNVKYANINSAGGALNLTVSYEGFINEVDIYITDGTGTELLKQLSFKFEDKKGRVGFEHITVTKSSIINNIWIVKKGTLPRFDNKDIYWYSVVNEKSWS